MVRSTSSELFSQFGGGLDVIDEFTRCYQIYLSDRIWRGKCLSTELEDTAIKQLLPVMGRNHLQRMLEEKKLSEQLMPKFFAWQEKKKEKKVEENSEKKEGKAEEKVEEKVEEKKEKKEIKEFNVYACENGCWLGCGAKRSGLTLPAAVQPMCDEYAKFYADYFVKHHFLGRRLDWDFSVGAAEVEVQFDPADKSTVRTLEVSTYQMLILTLFDQLGKKILTLAEMEGAITSSDHTNGGRKVFANHLLSLAHPKVAVLLKRPSGKNLKATHQFMINPKFAGSSKLAQSTAREAKIIVPLLRFSETKEKIDYSRRYRIECAVTYEMKTCRELDQTELRERVRMNPRCGAVTSTELKRAVEKLIEQEYIERDKSNRKLLRYLV